MKRTPMHLQPQTRRWWREIARTYELESHHVRLLILACEALDRGKQARELLDREGLVVQDRYGQVRAHPAAAIERQAAVTFARLVRELGLDTEGPPETRPPRIGGQHG